MLVKQYIISIVLLLYSCEKENDVAPWGVKRGVKNEANADC